MTITTFVVGAGASREFGLFDDGSLSASVITQMSLPKDLHGWALSDRIGMAIRRREDADELVKAANRLCDGLISSPSIDDFLHNHGEDAAMIFMGKLAVARCILEAEAASKFRRADGPRAWIVRTYGDTARHVPVFDNLPPATVMGALRHTWLGELFTQLTPGVSKSQVETIFDRIRFVCFNYDRCIETFLFYALQSHYAISAEHAGRIVAKLHIVHPYGTIGDLTFVPERHNPIAFGQRTQEVDLVQMAATIRTYNEQVEGCEQQELISQYMNDATTVAFLGFAFHKQNMALLKRTASDFPTAFATAYQVPSARLEVFQSRIKQANMTATRHLSPEACYPFICEFGPKLLD